VVSCRLTQSCCRQRQDCSTGDVNRVRVWVKNDLEQAPESHGVAGLWIQRGGVERRSSEQRVTFGVLNQMELEHLRGAR
jgi:hypothetical protein